MDPAQIQSDTSNDSHSLEREEPTIESMAQAASGVKKPPQNQTGPSTVTASTPQAGDPTLSSLEDKSIAPDTPAKKLPFFKRLWQRFNIYMLLFVLIVLASVATVIFFTIKDKQQTTSNTVSTQGLSENELKQLASSDSTIGSPKQTLNVESNAIFDGTVLVRNDLEVAGAIRVNGALALPGITVSGNSNFNQIQASSLGVTGAATVQGTLTARNGLNVNGNSNFSGNVSATQITTGSLQLNGDLVLTRHITAGGPIPSIAQGIALGGGGTTTLSGSDTTGSITINTGGSPGAGCFATITFTRAFTGTPHVVVTPIGAAAAGLQYYVNRSSSNFSVCTASTPPGSQTFGFDYMILN